MISFEEERVTNRERRESGKRQAEPAEANDTLKRRAGENSLSASSVQRRDHALPDHTTHHRHRPYIMCAVNATASNTGLSITRQIWMSGSQPVIALAAEGVVGTGALRRRSAGQLPARPLPKASKEQRQRSVLAYAVAPRCSSLRASLPAIPMSRGTSGTTQGDRERVRLANFKAIAGLVR